ncbi:hypothetical protein ACLIX5_004470 [Salmonella enterica subsp. enterica serovar Bredeney]
MEFYKHNYPIDSDIRVKFWGSNHHDNKVKAVIAFSLDYDNAVDNLRRTGWAYGWRMKKLEEYKAYINNPDFVGVPYSTT